MSTNGAAIPASAAGRRYDVDFLRVFAFGLLILYHVGMFYVAEWGWHVKSAHTADWLQLPMLLVNQWRMPVLFVISGLAISFVAGRYRPGRLAARRALRLLVPLVFGMAVVVAPQAYYEALGSGAIEPGFLEFMQRYLTFDDFPGEAWGGENTITWTWNHLWYLPYLLCYTLVLLAAIRVAPGKLAALQRRFARLRGPFLVLVPLVPLMAWGLFVYPRFPYVSHALIDDWYAHAQYFTFFAYGYLMGRDSAFWGALAAMRRPLACSLPFTFAAVLGVVEFVPEEAGVILNTLSLVVVYLNRWLWILALFAWAHHALNRPLRWLPYATEAVYPWYILHQTLIVVAGVHFARLGLGPVIEPLAVLAATIVGCLVLHEFVIRRSGPLRPLFGLSRRGGRPSPAGGQPLRESLPG